MNLYRFSTLILLLVIQSCSDPNNKKNENTQGQDSINRQTLIDPKHIEFSYDFVEDLPLKKGDILTLECSMKNKISDTIYFVAQTCFGFESTFIYEPSNVEHMSTVQCNTSSPEIFTLDPFQEFKFKSKFIVLCDTLKSFYPIYYIHQVDQKYKIESYDTENNVIITILKNSKNMN